MLKKKYRGISKKEIQLIFKNGNTSTLGNIIIKFVKNDIKNVRFSFIAGLKYSKKAVERNQAKKSLSRATEKYFKNLKQYDIVILLNGTPDNLNSKDIEKKLYHLFKKNSLFNN